MVRRLAAQVRGTPILAYAAGCCHSGGAIAVENGPPSIDRGGDCGRVGAGRRTAVGRHARWPQQTRVSSRELAFPAASAADHSTAPSTAVPVERKRDLHRPADDPGTNRAVGSEPARRVRIHSGQPRQCGSRPEFSTAASVVDGRSVTASLEMAVCCERQFGQTPTKASDHLDRRESCIDGDLSHQARASHGGYLVSSGCYRCLDSGPRYVRLAIERAEAVRICTDQFALKRCYSSTAFRTVGRHLKSLLTIGWFQIALGRG